MEGSILKCVCPLGWGLVVRTAMPIKDNSTISTESMERGKGERTGYGHWGKCEGMSAVKVNEAPFINYNF